MKTLFYFEFLNLNLNSFLFNEIWESNFRGSFYSTKIKSNDKVDELRPNTFSNSSFKGNRFYLNFLNQFL